MSEKWSIYIHIPFCIKKCGYCDFYSDTRLSVIPEFITALVKELALRSETVPNQMIDTLYFGGGTPSVLKISQVETLLNAVQKNFIVSPDAEITFEANPGTIDETYLCALTDIGINRLSLGTQSFNDEKLLFLKRIHSAQQSLEAVESAAKAGFENVSLDLIYGLPLETEAIWLQDLRTAIQMAPSHLSCYMLTIEPGTPLHQGLTKRQFSPISAEILWHLFEKTSQVLETSGYDHYEISSFSRGRENRSRHNCGYWDMKPYLGFGPAAHSYNGKSRSWNIRDIEGYIRQLESGVLPVEETEILTRDQKMLEMIMLRLRTLEGIDLEVFRSRFDISFEKRFEKIIDQICDESLGEIKNNWFFLTLKGKTRLNSIIEAFSKQITDGRS